jgi:hypothetical protein
MGNARCSCGAVTLSLPEEPSKVVVACHCIDCQRRTGAPFGVGAYYPADVVTISGTSKEFTHAAASGGKIHNYFCPQCGSTVYWKLSNLPGLIAVAVGAMADPRYPAPPYQFLKSRNMIGFKLMVPWSTSGKAGAQKLQTETPPKILVSEKFAHQRLKR